MCRGEANRARQRRLPPVRIVGKLAVVTCVPPRARRVGAPFPSALHTDMYGARLLPLVLLAAAPAALSAQRSLTSEVETAAMAWDRGDYVVAIEGFQRVLAAPGGDRHLESLALLTGELHQTTELTADGRAPRFSADGTVAVYESGAGADRALHVWNVSGTPRKVTELRASGGALSPRGDRIAYLRTVESSELVA